MFFKKILRKKNIKKLDYNPEFRITILTDLLQTAKTVGVTEVKDEDFLKGIAQNAVQLESALSNRKRKANSSYQKPIFVVQKPNAADFLKECRAPKADYGGDQEDTRCDHTENAEFKVRIKELENAELKERVTKLEQRQLQSDNTPNNNSSNFSLVADHHRKSIEDKEMDEFLDKSYRIFDDAKF
ncbi:hypothetical protein GLOIN_2v1777129 [Rhizophagus irregularis DAOM 181602=DAOM 197198]|uniref:Uncharacterized protein n=1 Tax=Rhizophagus irregularis (strain DAOM 181602 / DAOM 197198 / MUCL 43194) TaxID=747089 RepID=A0A2P4PVJ5_RHIID|nr:hypothetical protein GLOIN_2v1777129 [Rhizophagus irregularis DAOM 181602=DAOM 197198]POG69423.1 hypothetical protein GLOIN_2v1777129 [Rhizophagus irregularis DAOM 181602=DAOM 197198]|eukprot:XP_025176289.1 hypothetical protein GLOIN_2v1777129 [Rhizophagus irregularis DAOM 181602=DAOM 197198]